MGLSVVILFPKYLRTYTDLPLGLLSVSPLTYLVAISKRQQVAQIRGCPIYAITDVAFIPTTSQSEARNAIQRTKEQLGGGKGTLETLHSESELSDGDDEGETHVHHHDDNASVEMDDSPTSTGHLQHESGSNGDKKTTVAEDVMGRKGQYGMFAERWFSKKGWTAERRKSQGMSPDAVRPALIPSDETNAPKKSETSLQPPALNSAAETNVTSTLLPKLLRTTRLLFQSRSFFYAFDLDLSQRLENVKPRAGDLPLYKSADPLVSLRSNLVQCPSNLIASSSGIKTY